VNPSPLDRPTAFGLIVPPANPTVEPEIAWLLGTAARLHAARLPLMPGADLRERNRRYPGTYAGGVAAFGNLRLDALAVGLTGASYPLGAAGDAALCAELSARAGKPVATAARALVEALAALGAARVGLLSPYPSWLTEQALAFWAEAGVTVAETVTLAGGFRAYEVTAAEVAEALGRFATHGLDAILLSGTGMITLPAILPRVGQGPPLVSSNIASAWWLARAAGIGATEALAAACPALAARLAPAA
jgi:maleate isomerase